MKAFEEDIRKCAVEGVQQKAFNRALEVLMNRCSKMEGKLWVRKTY